MGALTPYSLPDTYRGVAPSSWQQIHWTTSVDPSKTYGTITATWKRYTLERRFDLHEDSWRDHGSPQEWVLAQTRQAQLDVLKRLEDHVWQ